MPFTKETLIRIPVSKVNFTKLDELSGLEDISTEHRDDVYCGCFPELFSSEMVQHFFFSDIYSDCPYLNYCIRFDYTDTNRNSRDFKKARALTDRERADYGKVFQKIDQHINMNDAEYVEHFAYEYSYDQELLEDELEEEFCRERDELPKEDLSDYDYIFEL